LTKLVEILRIEEFNSRITPKAKMGRQGSAQTQEELDENPSYDASLKSQPVSLNGREYTETRKCSLSIGYVSAGSGTEIVVCLLSV
jgi:hypothetical protein